MFCLLRRPGHFGHGARHPGEVGPRTLIQKLRLRPEREGAAASLSCSFKASGENSVNVLAGASRGRRG